MMTHSPETRAAVLEALRSDASSVRAIALAYGVHHRTVTRWAKAERIKLAPAAQRMAAGWAVANTRRWGAWEKRRAKARAMRAKGATLWAIAHKLGYKSVGAVHYALRD